MPYLRHWENLSLTQLFTGDSELKTHSFSNQWLDHHPPLHLFLCLYLLCLSSGKETAVVCATDMTFFMEVWALYKLTVIIVIVEVEIVKLLTSLQDGVHVLWEGLIHAAPHLSGSYIFPVFPLSVKQFQCRSCWWWSRLILSRKIIKWFSVITWALWQQFVSQLVT